MRKALTTTLTLAAVTALGLGLGPVGALAGDGGRDDDRYDDRYDDDRDRDDDELKVIGLAGGGTRLVSFSTDDPEDVRKIGRVSGLVTDSALIGIDYRVQDGGLYGVGNAARAGVYKINAETGAATLVNRLSVDLVGESFGVDFNPAADRLRIISSTGQNLRHNVNPGGVTIMDGVLTYTAPPATPVAATGVVGAAYTNNDLDATTNTTLFDIDTNLDQVSIQSPANNGILVATGKLGVDLPLNVAGFDVYSKLRNGKTVAALPYAVSTLVGSTRPELFDIDLLTGAASSDGPIGDPTVTDIAIPLNQL